jgi:hypothetical protein
VVDLPLEPRATPPKTALMRLVVLLFLGLLIFVAVIAIPMTKSKSGDLPDVECNIVVVGHTPDMRMLMGVGSSHPILRPMYEFVIKNVIRVPLPAALMSMFMPCS